MNKTKFNFAAVLAIVVLLVFSYFVFMGLDYWLRGNIAKAAGLTVGLIVVVLVCIYFLCKGKASRWKSVGVPVQVFFGVLMFAAVGLSSIPFSHFLHILGEKEKIYQNFTVAHEAATKLDEHYNTYRDSVVKVYQNKLATAIETKQVSNDYHELGLDSINLNDDEKVPLLTEALKRKMSFDSIASRAVAEQNERLEEATHISVWNVAMPTNLQTMESGVNNRVEQYVKMSKPDRYPTGFEFAPFVFTDYNTTTGEMNSSLFDMGAPSVWGVLLSLICFLALLFPWFLTEKSLATA